MINLNSGISLLGFLGVIGFLWKVSVSIRQEINDLNKRVGQIEGRVANIEGLLATRGFRSFGEAAYPITPHTNPCNFKLRHYRIMESSFS